MSLNPSSLQSLRRVFHHSFSAHDITEPLVSYEQFVDAGEIRDFMERNKLRVIGIRDAGLVIGYVERSSLGDGPCFKHVQSFDDQQVILDTTSLAEVILKLKDASWLFVSVFGRVGGIVTRSDLQKPPARMWLFGMITIIEMRVTQMIEQSELDEAGWKRYLSEGRLQKAQLLLDERTRRHQNLGLIDCLQFSDKCQIVARDKTLRSLTRYESRRQIEESAKKLEKLRNNLAHAQDIISADWEAVVELSENLDTLLEGTPDKP